MKIENDRARIVNIGCDDDGILVSDIAKIVSNICSPNASLEYGESNRGWLGDVPRFSYDISYLKSLGWVPSLTSFEAVERAAKEITKQFYRD